MNRRWIVLSILAVISFLVLISQLSPPDDYHNTWNIRPRALVFIGFTLLNLLVWEASVYVHRVSKIGLLLLGCLYIALVCTLILIFLRPQTPRYNDWNTNDVLVIGFITILLSSAWGLFLGAAYKGRGPPLSLFFIALVLMVIFMIMGLDYGHRLKMVTFFVIMSPIVLSFESIMSTLHDSRWNRNVVKMGLFEIQVFGAIMIIIICASFALLTANTWASS